MLNPCGPYEKQDLVHIEAQLERITTLLEAIVKHLVKQPDPTAGEE